MKTVWFLSVLLFMSITGWSEECFNDGDVVTFTGKISRATFPGRPNYESIDKGDEPETYWILSIGNPCCVVAHSMEDGSPYTVGKGMTEFQLTFEYPDVYESKKAAVGKDVTVTGQIFAGHTGHHHTKALISVKALKPLE